MGAGGGSRLGLTDHILKLFSRNWVFIESGCGRWWDREPFWSCKLSGFTAVHSSEKSFCFICCEVGVGIGLIFLQNLCCKAPERLCTESASFQCFHLGTAPCTKSGFLAVQSQQPMELLCYCSDSILIQPISLCLSHLFSCLILLLCQLLWASWVLSSSLSRPAH